MTKLITGIHHITALTSDAQKNVDFYTGILGLRLIKKTINFDAPDVYHLYYGNEVGSPGTILTFFPFPGMPQGRKGNGQLTVTSFSIPENSMDYWIKRLNKFNIAHKGPEQRFDELVIYFEDFDGLGLELVANSKDHRPSFTYGNIPAEFAIKGFYGITLSESHFEKTAGLLVSRMNHTLIGEKGSRFRYSTSEGKAGNIVDIFWDPDAARGIEGGGTVHHVAFATPNDEMQLAARTKVVDFGLYATPVIDREYFHSVYFREPGGVLFEIATMLPGFAIDELPEHLGESLKLPHWLEKNRSEIEATLPPLKLNLNRFAD